MFKRPFFFILMVVITGLALVNRGTPLQAWDSLPVADDPLVRMPGSQSIDAIALERSGQCLNCHADYDETLEPGFNWQGSMMAQATRDFLFWPAMTVAAQDSIWLLGRPNGTDLCLRCHTPKGWLADASDPTNGTALVGEDFDGVQCAVCHSLIDPFFEDTYQGVREGDDWLNYWDETNASGTPSLAAAAATYSADITASAAFTFFNGNPFYGVNHRPVPADYTEATAGQYFVTGDRVQRGPFADAAANHGFRYSRYHRSTYFCGTCHDVSNPAGANLGADPFYPLPSETQPAYSYGHVERTFSEFRLSAYGQPGGSPGIGPYAPDLFTTSYPGNVIAKCQDCHMADTIGPGADSNNALIRPTESVEHPQNGQPVHNLTGGNMWVPTVLASTDPDSPNYDPLNQTLLDNPNGLTMDLDAGLGLNPAALLAAADRARNELERAAAIEDVAYNLSTGALSFRVQNQTGHKLISGFPEGRRLFVNVRFFDPVGAVIAEVNPYDATVGTLKGLDPAYSPNSPPLAANEYYVDELVYEIHLGSTFLGVDETLHSLLATQRFKDNRIPPLGFRIDEAPERLAEPVWQGESAMGYFDSAEYAGGYDAVSLYDDFGLAVPNAASLIITLYYQTTSREYVEFLRDEINGTAGSLPDPGAGGDPAYLIQTDPFFSRLKIWGDTVWQVWEHNKDLPGAAPVPMTDATWEGVPTAVTLAPGAARALPHWPWLLTAALGWGLTARLWLRRRR